MVFFAAAILKGATVIKKEVKKNQIRNSVITAPGTSTAFASDVNTITPDWWDTSGTSNVHQPQLSASAPLSLSPSPPSNLVNKLHSEPTAPASSPSPALALSTPTRTETDSNTDDDEEASSPELPGSDDAQSTKRTARAKTDAANSHTAPPAGSFLAELQRENPAKHVSEPLVKLAPLPRAVTVANSSSIPSSSKCLRERQTAPPKGSFAAVVSVMQSVKPLKQGTSFDTRARDAEAVVVPPGVTCLSTHTSIAATADGNNSPVVRRRSKAVAGSFMEATARNPELHSVRPSNSSGPIVRRPSKHSWEAHVAASRN